jgi:DNA-binding NarL/FixJ family response regulator
MGVGDSTVAGAEVGVTSSERHDASSSTAKPPGGWRVRPGKAAVLLVDAMTLNRECVSRALGMGARDFEVAIAASACEIDASLRPDIVLFSINATPIDARWVTDSLAEIRRRAGDAPIILISALVDEKTALRGVAAGLRGLVPATVDIGMLVAAIRLVLAGGTFIPQDIVASYLKRAGELSATNEDDVSFLGLTTREAEVVRKLREGKLNKVIAYELDITESTVKIHVRHIMRKLNATNRTQVAYLVQNRTDPK